MVYLDNSFGNINTTSSKLFKKRPKKQHKNLLLTRFIINISFVKIFLFFISTNINAGAVAPYDLGNYNNPTEVTALTSVANLSGITYNPIANEYITIHQSSYCRLDSNLNEIFCGPLSCGDCEDIMFLGINGSFYEYAIVEEGGSQGSVVIVQSPMSSHILRFDQLETQLLTYAATAGGDSGEGIAFDPNTNTNTFYVCIEAPNKQVLSFTRPSGNTDVSYENGTLIVTETLTTAQLNSILGSGADLSSCYFHEVTERLWLMSHTAHNISDVDLNGTLIEQLSLPQGQVEGFTFNDNYNQLIIVSEPNNYQIYFSSDQDDVIFKDGFE